MLECGVNWVTVGADARAAKPICSNFVKGLDSGLRLWPLRFRLDRGKCIEEKRKEIILFGHK